MRIGIAGAAGYTAGELIRILLNHPGVELKYMQSESHRGEPIGRVHSDLIYVDNYFGDIDFSDIDLLFLCMGHGTSSLFLKGNKVPEGVKIIDLGNDFRLSRSSEGFIYGLPELNRDIIKGASRIANPGCFATAIELSLLPLAVNDMFPGEITVFGVTGSTGAGQKPTVDTHFSNRSQNLSNYKVFTHQHLNEIKETFGVAGFTGQPDIAFVPMRGNHSRGIMVNSVFESSLPIKPMVAMFKEYYESHPFTFVSDEPIYLKQVANTNYCFVHLQKEGDDVLITAVIDNLLKGASGQAVQNMNLMAGLEEDMGLRLKATFF